MYKVIAILMGLAVLNTVGGEEESPTALSQSADIYERTAIQEDLKPNDDSRTINIKIIHSEPLEPEISRTQIENDGHFRRSMETVSTVQDNVEPISKDFEDEVSKSKAGVDIDVQERSHEHVPILPGDVISRNEEATTGNDDLESVEGKGKYMIQDVMLETKGRTGDSPESLEEVKSASHEDVGTFNRLKPLDNSILRRRLSEITIPNYYKVISRSAFPQTLYNHQNTRPPYFGRLTNPLPSQSRRFEDSVYENTRRTGTFPTEHDQQWKHLEDYTDPDSNAYPYTPKASNVLIPSNPSQNVGRQQKLLSQINHFSNEPSPMQYAANFPYGVNAAFH